MNMQWACNEPAMSHFRPFLTFWGQIEQLLVMHNESKLAQNVEMVNIWRTGLFPDMRFSQDDKGHLVLPFSARKSTHQWLKFSSNSKNLDFWLFLRYFRNLQRMAIFPQESVSLTFFTFIDVQLYAKKTETSYDPIPRKMSDGRTNGRMDGSEFIGPFPSGVQ